MQVFESQFPEVLPLAFPEGVSAVGSMGGMHEVLTSAGLQNIEISRVCYPPGDLVN